MLIRIFTTAVLLVAGLNSTAMADPGYVDIQVEACTARTPTRPAGPEFKDCPTCPVMVPLAAGSYCMGGAKDALTVRNRNDRPIHRVNIRQGFAIGKYEITWDELQDCIADGGCNGAAVAEAGGDEGWGKGKRPAIHVNWNDAQAYVKWLSGKTGHTYRLPSESEWEYAARAGTTTRYAWGDDDPVCEEDAPNGANFRACPERRTRPVGSFPANAFGLHDMHGNVKEWCEDCFSYNYNRNIPNTEEPRVSGFCRGRITRSGHWLLLPVGVRSASRSSNNIQYRSNTVGFRVARDMP